MNNDFTKSIFIVGNTLEYVLFETAINSAKAGLPVWYISIVPFNKIPDNIDIPGKEVLNLITFIYLKDYHCLISHLNGIHLWRKTPRVILIDRFDLYSNINEENYNPLCGALISTSILDASSSISKKTNENIFLIVACSTQNIVSKRASILKNLYFPKTFIHSTDSETLKVINDFIIK